MEQNKTGSSEQRVRAGKYFKYAIGEIVLVVIGILIALQINNKSEQLKSDAKIEVLFEKVLVELTANINATQKVFQNSKHFDTLASLVRANKLTYDDYTAPKLDKSGNRVLRELFFPYNSSYNVVFLNTSAYDNLLLNMDLVPSKYDQIISELNIMYSLNKKEIDIANIDRIDFVKDIKAERRKKYKWHSSGNYLNNGLLDYMLNNYLYKNEVQGYRRLISSQLMATLSYRNRAVRVYQKLAILLNKPTLHDSFKLNPEVVRAISGTYKNVEIDENYKFTTENEGYSESYKLEENLIIVTQADTPDFAFEHTLLDYNITESKTTISMLRNSGSVYMTYIIEGDTLTVLNNNRNYWKFVKVK